MNNKPVDTAVTLARYAAEILDRAADDLDQKERRHPASADPAGYAAGYAAGRTETLEAVANGLRWQAAYLRDDPAQALTPPELRLR